MNSAKFDKLEVGGIPTSEVLYGFCFKDAVEIGWGTMRENIVVGERQGVGQAELCFQSLEIIV